ncbi:Uncharacterised protein [Salmonella enterica subsp. enterica serovar Typhi]|nr:Uncharacterised protein [Salmonella enterica subsp. enterica serovar Typhi]CIM71009.1 Uncharacterised protein [Salmonella enterica subsp. enterica serovar Typhi]CIN38252.1 Uncharacterised protein [Salmonella enterica subsp. enterica serovar Typhi]CIN38478.1 Uncharacterised protein [Salmonella enterica subsp. enterica serovar Typhi]
MKQWPHNGFQYLPDRRRHVTAREQPVTELVEAVHHIFVKLLHRLTINTYCCQRRMKISSSAT